jgi:hypothetical protein
MLTGGIMFVALDLLAAGVVVYIFRRKPKQEKLVRVSSIRRSRL